MNILYVTNRRDFGYISDRRRAASWAKSRGITLTKSIDQPIDYAILQVTSDFRIIRELKAPFTLDMVDMYLARREQLLKDMARGLVREDRWFQDVRFSRRLESVCKSAKSIVVGSEEQASFARRYNENVHVILDNHDEFGPPQKLRSVDVNKTKGFKLVWEGLSSNLEHLFKQSEPLTSFLKQTDSNLYIFTNQQKHRFMDKYFASQTKERVQKHFSQCVERVHFTEWSVESLKDLSMQMDFAIIPIDIDDPFAEGKPENKMLIYLRLGLPVLVSPTSAYRRVAMNLGLENFLVEKNDWNKALNPKELGKLAGLPARHIQEWLTTCHNGRVLHDKWDKVFMP